MLKKILTLIGTFLLVIVVFVSCGGKKADTIITGKVFTGKDYKMAEAIAIKDGEIVYVGDKAGAEAFKGGKTEVVENKGLIMPGFFDAHAHGEQGGVANLYTVTLYDGTTQEEYLNSVKAFIEENSDQKFITGEGWSNGVFAKDPPTAAKLDKISKDIPIVLTSEDYHSYWLNSKALELAGIDKNTKDVSGGVIVRDSDGNPTGVFKETAKELIDEIIPDFSVEQYKEGIIAYQKEVATYGMTSYFEPMVNLNGSKNLLKAYNALDEEGKLLMTVVGGYMLLPGEDIDKQVKEAEKAMKESKGGSFQVTNVKIMADGVIEGHTAYLLENYADEPNRGEPIWTEEQLKEVSVKCIDAGLQIHIHGIGDGAVKESVSALERAIIETEAKDIRPAITHLQLAAEEDIKKMGEIGITASTDPYWFCKEPEYFYELEVPYLGEERANKEYPMKDFFDAGVLVTAASDYPVTIPSKPLEAIQVGVTRCTPDGNKETLQNPSQRVTVEEMIMASTYNAAYSYFLENNIGTIEVGKKADIVLVEEDITAIDPFKIGSVKVLKTYKNGEVIFNRK